MRHDKDACFEKCLKKYTFLGPIFKLASAMCARTSSPWSQICNWQLYTKDIICIF